MAARPTTGKQPLWITGPSASRSRSPGCGRAPKRGDGSELHSCAIVTCEPSELVAPIHDRMPVILDREDEAGWLDPDRRRARLMGCCGPTEELELTEVCDAVNSVREDGPHLLDPPLQLF